jgi:hypothetical protein
MDYGDWGLGTGDWGLGTGDWGLGTGDWGLGTGEWVMGTDWPSDGPISLRPLVKRGLHWRMKPPGATSPARQT